MSRLLPKVALALLALVFPAFAAGFDSLGLVDPYISEMPGIWTNRVLVSGDGSTVASASGQTAFKWTRAGGKVILPGFTGSFVTALSHDGSLAVGKSRENDGQWWPATWTGTTKWILPIYPDPHATPTGVSADAGVIVGYQGYSGPAWKRTQNGSFWDISTLQKATGVSGNGQALVAHRFSGISYTDWVANRPAAPYARAFIWENWGAETEMVSLTGANGVAYASGISAGGQAVFGFSSSSTLFREACRWTAEGVPLGLGAAPGWSGATDQTWVTAANADGSVLVGWAGLGGTSYGSLLEQRAVIWDAQHGIRFLQDVLADEFGLDLAGWHLDEATGISNDGMTIAGYGTGPLGAYEAWVVTIPEPTSLSLLGLGLLFAIPPAIRRTAKPCR